MFYGGKTPLAPVCIMPQHYDCQHQFLLQKSPHQSKPHHEIFTVNRRSCYVSTGISIPADDRDFDIPTLKIQNPAVQLRIYERIEKYAKRIERLEALEIPAQRSAMCRKPTAGGFIA